MTLTMPMIVPITSPMIKTALEKRGISNILMLFDVICPTFFF